MIKHFIKNWLGIKDYSNDFLSINKKLSEILKSENKTKKETIEAIKELEKTIQDVKRVLLTGQQMIRKDVNMVHNNVTLEMDKLDKVLSRTFVKPKAVQGVLKNEKEVIKYLSKQ